MLKTGINRFILSMALCFCSNFVYADTGKFDMDRWYAIQDNIKERALAENISQSVIDATLQKSAFIPAVVKNDKNQSEFKLTMQDYLARTVSSKRISSGKVMAKKYPTLLSKIEQTYGIPQHVMLAFWGLESNYGEVKSKYKLKNAFFSLMYDGRREKFFTNQLIALMKIADKNNLDINSIHGSWAGAMGHFQFIPTTLEQYGTDGNGDGSIDIINNVSDAMYSAGNYLGKLGWNKNEKIVRQVIIPSDFDTDLLKGDVKKNLSEWTRMGVTNPDGSPIPQSDMIAGIVGDFANIDDNSPTMIAYLTYPNFYRIKKWNNSNWYAIAIALLSESIK